MIFGQQLAKRTQERTCGTRAAGLCRAKPRPAAAFLKPQIQNSRFKIKRLSNVCGIDSTLDKPAAERTGLHERTYGTRRCSPPPGGGCGLLRFLFGTANSAFKIR